MCDHVRLPPSLPPLHPASVVVLVRLASAAVYFRFHAVLRRKRERGRRRRATRKFEERISWRRRRRTTTTTGWLPSYASLFPARGRSKTAGSIRGWLAGFGVRRPPVPARGWQALPALGRRAAMSCHSLQSLFLTQLIIHLDEGGRRDAPQADTPTPSCSGDRPAGRPRMRWPSSCGRAERYPFRHGLMAMFAGLHWSVNLVGVLNTPFSMGKGLSTAASSRCGPVGLGSRKPMSCSLIC